MEIGPILLAVLWIVVSLVGRAAEKGKREGPKQPPREHRRSTQRAETFEDLLAEMRGELDRARQGEEAATATLEGPAHEASWEEQVEDITTLEREVEVVSLEEEPAILERTQGDASLETQRVVAARLAAAERRNREWRLEDHRRFDQAIRAPLAEAPPRRTTLPAGSLRTGIIWREILDRPVSLRD